MLLKLAAKTLAGRAKRKADGYQGAEFKGSESDDLVSGMQWLQTAYTAWFNRRHGLKRTPLRRAIQGGIN